MRSVARTAAFTAACLAALGAVVAPEVNASDRPSAGVLATPRAEVTRELREVCETVTSSTNSYYGRGQIGLLEQALAGTRDPRQEIELRRLLARNLLRLGEARRSAEELDRALRRATEVDAEVELRVWILVELGVSLLRLGEVMNCVALPHPERCVFPISESGRHPDPRAAQDALRIFRGIVEIAPDLPLAAWLANIAAMSVGADLGTLPERHRVAAERLVSEADVGRFANVAHDVGLHVETVSGGAVVDDFDGDGHLDVLTSSADPCEPLHFYRQDGRGSFIEATATAGLENQLGGLNLVHADYDGDGHLDVLLLRGGWLGEQGRMRNSLLRNRGDGSFEDVTAAAGLASPAYPTQTAAWADYDLDGDLDLYVGNEAMTSNLDDPTKVRLSGTDTVYPSQLFRNNGDGTFTDVAAIAGVTNDRFAKGVTWSDLDGDGDPDLYVSNFGRNRLYHNQGDGTFEDVAAAFGVEEPAERSFATWAFDHDNDGDEDLFVADYNAEPADIARHYLGERVSTGRPLLYENRGGTFVEVGERLGLTTPTLPMGANFGDLDNDGFLDFYLGTGLPPYEALVPNLMYRNDGGRGFQDVTFSGGFGHLQKGHGIAFADVDDDGDQDVFEQMGGAFPGDAFHSALYRNPGHGRPWLKLELVGRRSNRSAIGTRVKVTVRARKGPRVFFRTIGPGGSFGGSPLRLELGLGDATEIDAVEVRWPASGLRQVLKGIEMRRAYRLVEPATRSGRKARAREDAR